MIDQNITTLLAALIGGLLSALGGFLANYYMQSSSNQFQRINEVRNLSEKIYKYMLEIEHLCSKITIEYVQNHSSEDIEDILHGILSNENNIRLIVDLYLNSLKEDFSKYQNIADSYVNCKAKPVSQLNNQIERVELGDLAAARDRFAVSLVKLRKKKGYSLE